MNEKIHLVEILDLMEGGKGRVSSKMLLYIRIFWNSTRLVPCSGCETNPLANFSRRRQRAPFGEQLMCSTKTQFWCFYHMLSQLRLTDCMGASAKGKQRNTFLTPGLVWFHVISHLDGVKIRKCAAAIKVPHHFPVRSLMKVLESRGDALRCSFILVPSCSKMCVCSLLFDLQMLSAERERILRVSP